MYLMHLRNCPVNECDLLSDCLTDPKLYHFSRLALSLLRNRHIYLHIVHDNVAKIVRYKHIWLQRTDHLKWPLSQQQHEGLRHEMRQEHC